MDTPAGFVAGNTYDKYRTRNPLHRRLMERFLSDARELAALARPRRVLEIGCGPGDLAGALFADRARNASDLDYLGTDVSAAEVERARAAHPALEFRVASAYELPFADGEFDLVVACEVLEHLESPARALREAERVCRGHVLISVPWEPLWRLLNLARGAYVTRLGNTPGHLRHFSRRAIRRLVGKRLEIVAERRPFPWTMLLGRVGPTPP